MRFLLIASLLVTAVGCAGARHAWRTRYDHKPSAHDARLAEQSGEMWKQQPPPDQPPANVARSTESGPSGMAAGGR